MKYLAIVLCICLLLSGCVAKPEPAPQKTSPTEQVIPDCELPPESTEPEADDLTPPPPYCDTVPEPPTGTDSTAPAPEIGPEGLPTPAL